MTTNLYPKFSVSRKLWIWWLTKLINLYENEVGSTVLWSSINWWNDSSLRSVRLPKSDLK